VESPPGGYEEVRRKLRERGYLEGRIERFVLREAIGPGSRPRQLVRTGLKAAVVGAPLLGAVLAGAAVAVNRPLLGAADAFVLWFWFAILSGAVLFFLDLAAAALVGALAARRGARASDTLRAATMVGLPVLGYLAALWALKGRGGGLLADGVFLAAALVASLLAAWLAGLVSLAGIVGKTGDPPRRQPRSLPVLAGILVPGAALGFALASVLARTPEEQPPSPFEPRDGVERLLFVGVDGLDAELVQALAERGAFQRLLEGMERSAVFPKKRAAGIEPPEVWTTILTGMPADVHGVRSVGAERLPGVATPLAGEAGPVLLGAAMRFLLPGRTVPASGATRAVRTLWEIVALEREAVAVGWWASWPAFEAGASGAGRAWVVTDRVLPKLLAGAIEADRDTAPASLFDRLRGEFPADREAIREEFARRFGRLAGKPAGRLLWESYLIDAYAVRLLAKLAPESRAVASFAYLPGLDILRGRLEAERKAAPLARLLEAQEAIEAYGRALDGMLGEWFEKERAVVLVADPGRSAAADSEGFVLVRDGGAEAGCVGPTVSDLDVAPLVLALLGFPASEEMRGGLPDRCLERAWRERVGRIPTYGRRRVSGHRSESVFDREMVERLRSLGYLR